MAKQVLMVTEGDIGLVVELHDYETVRDLDQFFQDFKMSENLDEWIALVQKEEFWQEEGASELDRLMSKFKEVKNRVNILEEYACSDDEYCVSYVVIFEGNEEEFKMEMSNE